MTAGRIALACVLALSGCASMSGHHPALQDAQGRYDLARSDPQVVGLAPAELDRAGLALRAARQAVADGQPTAQVDHLAYLANQRVTIARDEAGSRASQALVAALAADGARPRQLRPTRAAEAPCRQAGTPKPGDSPLSR